MDPAAYKALNRRIWLERLKMALWWVVPGLLVAALLLGPLVLPTDGVVNRRSMSGIIEHWTRQQVEGADGHLLIGVKLADGRSVSFFSDRLRTVYIGQKISVWERKHQSGRVTHIEDDIDLEQELGYRR